MEKSTRLSLRLQIRSFKNTFFQFNDLPFKGLLSDSLLKTIHQSGSSRDTVFTPLITLRAFLFQVLSSTGACTEAVTPVLIERLGVNCSENSMNTGPSCNARSRLSLSHLKETVTSSGEKLHNSASNHWLWNDYRVMLVDGTTLLMPDTRDNQKTYPQQCVQKPGIGFPIVCLVGLLSLATGGCVDYALGPFQGKGSGETSLFSQLIGSLGTSDLLLADRYYTTYAIMALLLNAGNPTAFQAKKQCKK